MQNFNIKYIQVDGLNPGYIKIDLYDKDGFLNSDDELGYVFISLKEILL